MKIRDKTNREERAVLIGMIVDPIVLGRITTKWQKGMFKSRWANIVGNWCVKYYTKYNKPPKGQIEHLFSSWSAKTQEEDTIKLVERFLGSLSKEYEELEQESNSNYVLDLAKEYFNKVKIDQLASTIQGDVERGMVDDALSRVTSFNQVEIGGGEGIDILQDREAIKEAFAEKKESIIQYPGALGNFFNKALERDALISFMGPDKVGKSFWLVDVAYRAMLQRRKVAFFEVGDMSQNQVMRRLMTRVARRPIWPGCVDYPIDIEKEEGNKVCVSTEEREFKKMLGWRAAAKACEQVMRKKVKSKKPYFKLSCHPNSTLSVRGMKAILDSWAREDWVPDVIVIDYADILNMDAHGVEGRDRINETWKALRSLSQIYHCLIVTASQTNAGAYGTNLITRNNFSEDKRKLAHVTGMIGINATEEEKKMGVTRLNWVVLRESPFVVSRCVFVAGCLGIANPAIRSTF